MTRTALITGVGRRRGIGAGVAAGLAADGWDLLLSFWRPYDERIGLETGPDDPGALADELRSTGVEVELVAADLEDPGEPQRLIDEATARFGQLDALVMCHAESVDSDLLTTTVESFDRHYAVNVRASWLLLAAFVRQLPASGGSVVALTSDHTVDNLPYGATKAALDRLVLAAAHELGDRGLRANVINPGPIDTGWMTPDQHDSLRAMQPTGHLGTPTDIAHLVRVWDLVSDVTRIGEFSPETFEAQWLDGATGPELGAKFRGHVKRNGIGPIYWTNCEVTSCESERDFGFAVYGGGSPTNTWCYHLVERGNGTDVTESFELPHRPLLRVYWLIVGWRRGKVNERGMRQTLERIKTVAENDPGQ